MLPFPDKLVITVKWKQIVLDQFHALSPQMEATGEKF